MQKLTATYSKDTLRMHCYLLDEGQDIKGSLYIPKDSTGGIPKEVLITLKVKEA